MLKINAYNLVDSKARDEDLRRQEFIMNVLLLGSVLLALCATAVVTIQTVVLPPSATAHAAPPAVLLAVLIVFSSLYALSRRGFHRVASYSFLGIYLLASTNTMAAGGFQNWQAWLLFALIITTGGIVLGLRTAVGSLVLTSAAACGIWYAQTRGITHPEPIPAIPTPADLIMSIVLLAVITLVSWLFLKDVYRALQRARTSEKALKEERDLLEVRVEERTAELRHAQQEEISRLYRFAQFGRLTSGILHDILNPLTAVALNLEELGRKDRSASLKDAIENTRRMERFIEATRREIQDQHDFVDFSVAEEIGQSVDILRYRANRAHATIAVDIERDAILHNSPVKFHQIISNLVSNAIDACSVLQDARHDRVVRVKLSRPKRGTLLLTVSDNAGGMPPEVVSHIFEPLFTTKDIDHGTGLGLSVCQEVVEQDFKGTLSVESAVGTGSTFSVRIPVA